MKFLISTIICFTLFTSNAFAISGIIETEIDAIKDTVGTLVNDLNLTDDSNKEFDGIEPTDSQLAIDSAKSYVLRAREIQNGQYDPAKDLDEQRFAAYCGLSHEIINIKDVSFSVMKRLYSKPDLRKYTGDKSDPDAATDQLKFEIEEQLRSNFSSLFLDVLSGYLKYKFDWDNADAEFATYKRPDGSEAPAFKVYVTMTDEIANSEGVETEGKGTEVEIFVTQNPDDLSSFGLADMKIASIRVSRYFSAVTRSLRSNRKTYNEVLADWKDSFGTCP